MKIIAHRNGLLNAANLLLGAVAPKPITPVLANLKAVAVGDALTLVATDSEIGVRVQVASVKVDEPGEALWVAAKLAQVLKESTEELVCIDSGIDRTLIHGSGSEFELPGEDPAVYPDLPAFTATDYYEVKDADLKLLLRRTAFAVADENARYTATKGVLFCKHDGQFTLVATDGRRMAVTECPAAMVGAPADITTQQFVLPKKAVQLLDRCLDGGDATVKLAFTTNEAMIRTERGDIYTRLVEGRFPAWQKVLPARVPQPVSFEAGALRCAVKQAALMTDEDSHRVEFAFTPNTLTLRAKGRGRARVDFPLMGSQLALSINLAPGFLVEWLKAFDDDQEIVAHFKDAAHPVLFEVGEKHQFVLVPIVAK